MFDSMKTAIFMVLMVCSVLGWATPATAYLDPGSTSMIWQLVLGALAGVAVFFKFFWKKLASLFSFRNEKKQGADPSDEPS